MNEICCICWYLSVHTLQDDQTRYTTNTCTMILSTVSHSLHPHNCNTLHKEYIVCYSQTGNGLMSPALIVSSTDDPCCNQTFYHSCKRTDKLCLVNSCNEDGCGGVRSKRDCELLFDGEGIPEPGGGTEIYLSSYFMNTSAVVDWETRECTDGECPVVLLKGCNWSNKCTEILWHVKFEQLLLY